MCAIGEPTTQCSKVWQQVSCACRAGEGYSLAERNEIILTREYLVQCGRAGYLLQVCDLFLLYCKRKGEVIGEVVGARLNKAFMHPTALKRDADRFGVCTETAYRPISQQPDYRTTRHLAQEIPLHGSICQQDAWSSFSVLMTYFHSPSTHTLSRGSPPRDQATPFDFPCLN